MCPTPVVAVIIANRNYNEWVVGAIQSAEWCSSHFHDLHIIVADDGSTDDSVSQILEHKSDSANDITLLVLDENEEVSARVGRGPSYARNRAIEFALEVINPDVFMMLDADDEFHPDKIRSSLDAYLTDPDLIGVVYSDYEIIGPEGSNYTHKEFKEPFSKERLLQENIVHSCSLVSKKAILECGMYDESLRTCEDYDLWCKISQKFVIVHIPEILMTVRTTGLNSTFTVPMSTWNENLNTVRKRYVQKLHS